MELALRFGARRSPAVRRIHRHHAGHGHHRRGSRATSSCYAPKDGSFHVLDRASGKAISVKKLGMGAHNHFAQSFSPKTGLAYRAHHRIAGIERSTAMRRRMPARARSSHGIPVKQQPLWAVPTPGAFSGGVLSTAGELVFQGQADGYHHCLFRGRRPSRVGVLYRHGGARRAHQFRDRQAPVHLDSQRTHARNGRKPRRDVRPIRLGFARCIRGACSRSCSMARAHCRPRPVPRSRRPWTAAIWSSMKRWRKRARSCSRSVSGATAQARLPAVARRICARRCRPWWRRRLRAWYAAEMKSRGMPKFEELSDRELDALRHYIRARARRVTRPDGVAPPAPEAPAPAPRSPAEEPSDQPNRLRVRSSRRPPPPKP